MTERKKVVFVLSGYGRYARGAERFVEELVTRLSDTFDIQVLGGGPDAPGAVPLSFLSRDTRWTNRIQRTPILGHASRVFQLDPLNWEWLTCAWAARRWLNSNPCDLLIPEGGRWGGWLGRWARKRFGIPFIDIAHGAPSRWEVAAARYKPDCYITPTRVAERIIREAVPGLETRVILPGVDLNAFTPDGPKFETDLQHPVIIAVGALEPLKGMDAVIRAVHAWGRGSLLLVGDGPERERLIQLGTCLLGEGRFLSHAAGADEMPALYRCADLFVSASRSEAFGLVYLEALASGLPVVTVDDAVRREVLAEAGYFVDSEEPTAWAAGMEAALQTLGPMQARDRAKLFDSAQTAIRYGELFKEVIRL